MGYCVCYCTYCVQRKRRLDELKGRLVQSQQKRAALADEVATAKALRTTSVRWHGRGLSMLCFSRVRAFYRMAEKSFSKSWRRRKPYTRNLLQSWSATSHVIQTECRSYVSAAIRPTLSVHYLLPLNGHCISIRRKCNSPFLFTFKCTIPEHTMARPPHAALSVQVQLWLHGVGVGVRNSNEIVIKCANWYLTNWTKSMKQDLLHWVRCISVALCLYLTNI